MQRDALEHASERLRAELREAQQRMHGADAEARASEAELGRLKERLQQAELQSSHQQASIAGRYDSIDGELRSAQRQLEESDAELRATRRELQHVSERADTAEAQARRADAAVRDAGGNEARRADAATRDAERLREEVGRLRDELDSVRQRPPPPRAHDSPQFVKAAAAAAVNLEAEVERLRYELHETHAQRGQEARRAEAAEMRMRQAQAELRHRGPPGSGVARDSLERNPERSPPRARSDDGRAASLAEELRQAHMKIAALTEDLKRMDVERQRQLRELASRKDGALLQVCLRWPSMAFNGLRWPSMAFDGPRWPSMALRLPSAAIAALAAFHCLPLPSVAFR